MRQCCKHEVIGIIGVGQDITEMTEIINEHQRTAGD